ncbi:MAG: hypothetical protein ACXVC6_01435 [Bacteroidia bacterium]
MNYLMLLSLMLPVAIVLFLVSALLKEENNLYAKKPENTSTGNQAKGEMCCEKINSAEKQNPKNYMDFSGGNWGI